MYKLSYLLNQLLTNALARINLISYFLKRELRVRRLNNYAQDNAIMRVYCANENQLFRAYEDYVNRVELALKVDIAIVLIKESYALCLLVIEDCYF